ncbi:MAG: helix-turn-helix domain-containing protein [Micrococcales bacterium]|nr:helix-turn-helix domain-containing protein [Micrococcales bacterium]
MEHKRHFYTVAEVAQMMRVSPMTIYRLIRSGELRALRVGHSYRVPAESLEDFMSAGGSTLAGPGQAQSA